MCSRVKVSISNFPNYYSVDDLAILPYVSAALGVLMLPSKAAAMLDFESLSEAELCVETVHGMEVEGELVSCVMVAKTSLFYLDELVEGTSSTGGREVYFTCGLARTEADARQELEQHFGVVDEVIMHEDSPGQGYVLFDDSLMAEKCKNEMPNVRWSESERLLCNDECQGWLGAIAQIPVATGVSVCCMHSTMLEGKLAVQQRKSPLETRPVHFEIRYSSPMDLEDAKRKLADIIRPSVTVLRAHDYLYLDPPQPEPCLRLLRDAGGHRNVETIRKEAESLLRGTNFDRTDRGEKRNMGFAGEAPQNKRGVRYGWS